MWIAGIFGPYLIIMGLWMLFYHDNMMKVLTSLKNSPASLMVSSVISLIVGLAVISEYNVWMWQLALLVTLFGWYQLVRGVMVLFLPQLFIKLATNNQQWLKVKGLVPLIWGFLLCWLAFWM